MFEHIVVFLSFIYAIAISHPLASGHELITARARVRWSPLLVFWMLSALLLLILNWLVIFRLSDATTLSTGKVLAHIAAAVAIYYTCALTSIRPGRDGEIDLRAAFTNNRVPILSAFLVFGFLALGVNLLDLSTPGLSRDAALSRLVGIVPNMVAEAIGLAFRAEWVQWVVALFVLGRLTVLLIQRILAG